MKFICAFFLFFPLTSQAQCFNYDGTYLKHDGSKVVVRQSNCRQVSVTYENFGEFGNSAEVVFYSPVAELAQSYVANQYYNSTGLTGLTGWYYKKYLQLDVYTYSETFSSLPFTIVKNHIFYTLEKSGDLNAVADSSDPKSNFPSNNTETLTRIW